MKKLTKYIPWTGGLDSTYLIYKNLCEGHQVVSASLVFMNNPYQSMAEFKAKSILLPLLKKVAHENNTFFDYDPYYNMYVKVGGSQNMLGQLSFLSISYRYLSYTKQPDVVEFAYVKGDCIFLEEHEFEKLFTENFYNNEKYNVDSYIKKAKLDFPLRDTSKEEIIKLLPKEILENVSWCENPRLSKFLEGKEYDEFESALFNNKLTEEHLSLLVPVSDCGCSSCDRMSKIYKKQFKESMDILSNQIEQLKEIA